MTTNEDALDALEKLQESAYGVYIRDADEIDTCVQIIRNALQTQSELVEACDECYNWFATKRDRPSLCGMGHEDYAEKLIRMLKKDPRGADLRGANLSGTNLSSADLSSADLRGAK